MAPKDVPILTPQICGYVTSHGIRGFADGTEVQNLEIIQDCSI